MANVTDFLGNTALHRAMTTGARSEDRQEACSALLRSPCFTALGAANSNGQTALHLAALKGDSWVCRAILHHSCRADELLGAVEALGMTAADLAEGAGYDDLAEELSVASVV
ncbi:unnamed protein product [Polarella glacialis]|uniref:Uncharacterized protein n=1 Tax=Polarella glacialis TaxID=89957 RepID=A0A813FMB4_POLGL|nr:unnamed protein product [Polarella glacialis]